MELIFFCHPDFLSSQSMPRFARMLAEGMKARGHQVNLWKPKAVFSRLPGRPLLKKWLGYIDQFFVFPILVLFKLRGCRPDTLFVFTDHALGPWVPLVAHRPHVIHCHDFLAQFASLGNVPGQTLGLTGRWYQQLIRKGYSKGKHFISVSSKTQEDLHQMLPQLPNISEVVYNGLSRRFHRLSKDEARAALGRHLGLDLSGGFLLHVGGNQWYKNRLGLIRLYEAWRNTNTGMMPLLLVGETPDASLLQEWRNSSFSADVHFVVGLQDQWVDAAYCGAVLFLFPSIAEGFGWPIIEAMACGCMVATTGIKPMTEVGGDVAFYFDECPKDDTAWIWWAAKSAVLVNKILYMSECAKEQRIAQGLQHATCFDSDKALVKIEKIYTRLATGPVNN